MSLGIFLIWFILIVLIDVLILLCRNVYLFVLLVIVEIILLVPFFIILFVFLGMVSSASAEYRWVTWFGILVFLIFIALFFIAILYPIYWKIKNARSSSANWRTV